MLRPRIWKTTLHPNLTSVFHHVVRLTGHSNREASSWNSQVEVQILYCQRTLTIFHHFFSSSSKQLAHGGESGMPDPSPCKGLSVSKFCVSSMTTKLKLKMIPLLTLKIKTHFFQWPNFEPTLDFTHHSKTIHTQLKNGPTFPKASTPFRNAACHFSWRSFCFQSCSQPISTDGDDQAS